MKSGVFAVIASHMAAAVPDEQYYRMLGVPKLDGCSEHTYANATGYEPGRCKDVGFQYLLGSWGEDWDNVVVRMDVYGNVSERSNLVMMRFHDRECGQVSLQSTNEALALRSAHPEFFLGEWIYLGEDACSDNWFGVSERSANETFMNRTYVVQYNVQDSGTEPPIFPDYHMEHFPEQGRCSQASNVTEDLKADLESTGFTPGHCTEKGYKFLDGMFPTAGSSVDVFAPDEREQLWMVRITDDVCAQIRVPSTAEALAIRAASDFRLGEYYVLSDLPCGNHWFSQYNHSGREDVWNYMYPVDYYLKPADLMV